MGGELIDNRIVDKTVFEVQILQAGGSMLRRGVFQAGFARTTYSIDEASWNTRYSNLPENS
jgi:hypothetical protein